MRLIAERRILVYVGVMMGGVALVTIHHDLLASPAIAGTIAGIIAVAFTVAAICGLRPAGGRMARWQPVMVGIA